MACGQPLNVVELYLVWIQQDCTFVVAVVVSGDGDGDGGDGGEMQCVALLKASQNDAVTANFAISAEGT